MFNYKHALISIAAAGSLLTMLLSLASQYNVISLSVFSLMWGFATYRHAKDTKYSGSLYELAHLLTVLCFSFGHFGISTLIAFNTYSLVEPIVTYTLLTAAVIYSITCLVYVWFKLNIRPDNMAEYPKVFELAFLCTFVAYAVSLISAIVDTMQKHPII